MACRRKPHRQCRRAPSAKAAAASFPAPADPWCRACILPGRPARIVAILIEPALLQVEPVVEDRMRADAAQLLAAEVHDAVGAGVGTDNEAVKDVVDGLAEIDPLRPARTQPIGGNVIAAAEFQRAGLDAGLR